MGHNNNSLYTVLKLNDKQVDDEDDIELCIMRQLVYIMVYVIIFVIIYITYQY